MNPQRNIDIISIAIQEIDAGRKSTKRSIHSLRPPTIAGKNEDGRLEEENMDIDTQWQHIKESWTSTCNEILGKKKYQNKEWISADTINKMQTRKEKKSIINNGRTRAAKTAAHKQYAEANRVVKKSVKKKLHRQHCQKSRGCRSPRKHETTVRHNKKVSGKVQAGRQAYQRQESTSRQTGLSKTRKYKPADRPIKDKKVQAGRQAYQRQERRRTYQLWRSVEQMERTF